MLDRRFGRFANPTILRGAVALMALAGLFAVARGETKRERTTAAKQLVMDALLGEAAGYERDRAALLEAALEKVPRYEPAMWHTGHVKLRRRWVKADEVPKYVQDDLRVIAYLKARDEAPDTVAGQLALAKWCGERHLADQQRAHLTRVLELAPDHAEARAQLGFRRVDNIWLSAEEIAGSEERAKTAARDLAEWKPKIEQILQGLTARSLTRRNSAAVQLAAIDDPAAIPALELVLSSVEESIALKLVDTLAAMRSSDAALALARQAVFSPWGTVRDQATLQLKSRPEDAYIPALLSAMYTPIQSRAGLYKGPGGRLMYRHIFFREGQQQKQLAVLDTAYRRNALPGGDAGESLGRALADANAKFQLREQQVAQQNEFTQELNARIAELLNMTTEQVLPAEAEPWWEWWNQVNEVYIEGDKQTHQKYSSEQITITDTGPGSGGPPITGGGSPPLDCLAKGTTVWTSLGPAAIERLRIGDLVLSQDPETGELVYKPVLRTTVRPASKLVKIQVGSQSIMTSGGHLFWVAGEGWTRSRKIVDGAALHGVNGTARVEYVSDGDVAETYNIVVADFHTYFVGPQRVLSHDNTIHQRTDVVVPGLQE